MVFQLRLALPGVTPVPRLLLPSPRFQMNARPPEVVRVQVRKQGGALSLKVQVLPVPYSRSLPWAGVDDVQRGPAAPRGVP